MLKSFLLLHEGRYGLVVYRFSTSRDVARLGLLGLAVYADLDGDHRDLIRFLSLTVESGDYIIVKEDVKSVGVW